VAGHVDDRKGAIMKATPSSKDNRLAVSREDALSGSTQMRANGEERTHHAAAERSVLLSQNQLSPGVGNKPTTSAQLK